MIGIYAEGNETIGIGHVMRCLTIADALVSCGQNITFYSNSCKELIESRGYKPEPVTDGFYGSDAEIAFWEKNVKQKGLTLLLLDGYRVSPAYFNALGDLMKTVYLDDMCSFQYPVDMVINYNIFANVQDYGDLPERTALCLGTAYAPIRKEFVQNRTETLATDMPEILISVGGSDSLGIAPVIVKTIKESLAKSRLHVLCGPYSRQKEELKSLKERYGEVVIYENVSAVWDVMRKCNMAVSAGGTTMYELSAMGLPVLTFYFVENQRRIAEGFARKGAAIGLGAYEKAAPDRFVQKLSEEIHRMANDNALAEQIRKRAMECVDGMGAVRIARKLTELDSRR